jgi:hypothetical protein
MAYLHRYWFEADVARCRMLIVPRVLRPARLLWRSGERRARSWVRIPSL